MFLLLLLHIFHILPSVVYYYLFLYMYDCIHFSFLLPHILCIYRLYNYAPLLVYIDILYKLNYVFHFYCQYIVQKCDFLMFLLLLLHIFCILPNVYYYHSFLCSCVYIHFLFNRITFCTFSILIIMRFCYFIFAIFTYRRMCFISIIIPLF